MAENRDGKVIAFYNMKGGEGKTTLSTSTALWLARNPRTKVLMIDLDGQCNASDYLGFEKEQYQSEAGTEDSILNIPGINLKEDGIKIPAKDPKTIIRKSPFFHIDVIMGHKKINKYWERDKKLANRLDVLLDAIDELRPLYDFIIMDCHPDDSTYTMNGLCASDYVVLVSDTKKDSMEGIKNYFDDTLPTCLKVNRLLETIGIVSNFYERSFASYYSFDMNRFALKNKSRLFETKIRRSVGYAKMKDQDAIDASHLERNLCAFDSYMQHHYPAVTEDIGGFVRELRGLIIPEEEI